MLIILLMLLGAITATAVGAPALAMLAAVAAALALAGPRLSAGSLDLASEAGNISTFIPEFWVQRLLAHLRKALVYGQPNVANRNYEGEINQAGDTVRINQVGDVTIRDYVRNTDIAAPEELTTALTTLAITQEKYFNFAVDDVDAAQAAGSAMGQGMENAGYGLRDVADQFLASHYVDADAGNLIGSDGAPETIGTADAAYEYLVDLGVLLDEADVPTENRFAVLPPWYHGLLRKDDRFVASGDGASTQARLNGEIGEAAGFTLLKSNNVPFTAGDGTATFDNHKVIAGIPQALSYAEQVNKTEAYRPDNRFSDAVKGLHVYGGKLVYPKAWAVLSAAR